jgi:hypothetical protein
MSPPPLFALPLLSIAMPSPSFPSEAGEPREDFFFGGTTAKIKKMKLVGIVDGDFLSWSTERMRKGLP